MFCSPQNGGTAKFRLTRKFSKDRSRILSIYYALNFSARSCTRSKAAIVANVEWKSLACTVDFFHLRQVVLDISYLGGHFTRTFPAVILDIYYSTPSPGTRAPIKLKPSFLIVAGMV